MKKKYKRIAIISILLSIILLIGLIYYKESYDTIFHKDTTQVTKKQVETVTVTDGKLHEIEYLAGRYQFNTAAAGIGDKKIGISHVEEVKSYEKNHNSNFLGNSSGGYLDGNYNIGGKIKKAYLLIETTADRSASTNDLASYPITFLHMNEEKETTEVIESKTEYCYKHNDREAGYIDVTDFIKRNGYGWYYVCNVPFKVYNSDSDEYACWKLIVIEENQNLPIRILSLQVGSPTVYAGGSAEIKISGKNITSRKIGDVTGQVLFSFNGADAPGVNTLKFSETGSTSNLKNIIMNNGTRSTPAALRSCLQRNGTRLIQNSVFPTKMYFAGHLTSSAGGFTTSSNISGYTMTPVDGGDLELLDIDPKQTYSNIQLKNNVSGILMKFEAQRMALTCTGLGICMDIDTPEFISSQTSKIKNKENVIVEGRIENNSEVANTGFGKGTLNIEIDDALNIEEYEVYLNINDTQTKLNGEIVDNKIVINNVDMLNNDNYLTYKVKCSIIDKDKEIFYNSDNFSGYLYLNSSYSDFCADNITTSSSKALNKEQPLVLTSKVNLNTEDKKGEVILEWLNYDISDKYFVIYRKEKVEDEWKVIVNLEEKFNRNTYIDTFGNDKDSPDVPSININSTTINNINVETISSDNGSPYIYYIEAYDADSLDLLNTSNEI